eukprot:TRINITY_DN14656_c0_g1_i1.p1 TRINITY_DN14656_c0_g1~~TRINITY_DN14656_c0_g1_i1.p1  ORF type:complete len:249 (-),score=39.50 TRINITY_DN14656_c0_g1_i1:465-1211(-)
MERVKVSAKTALEYPGLVEVDKDGFPVGCFHEESANIFQEFFRHTLDQRLEALNTAIKLFVKNGIVGYQDALVRGSNITTYFNAVHNLQLKVSLALWWDPEGDENAQIEKFKLLRSRCENNNKLLVRTVKLMVDGVLETQTAFMHQPYCNCNPRAMENKPHYGHAQFSQETLDKVVRLCHVEGFQIHAHTVGDKALTMILDSFEKVWKENPENFGNNRHQVAHLQVVRPEDVCKLKKLGIVANYQPLW